LSNTKLSKGMSYNVKDYYAEAFSTEGLCEKLMLKMEN
jgi:hypothetical protein